MSVLQKLTRVPALWRYMGPNWLQFRVRYAARLHLGLLERTLPLQAWHDAPLAGFLADTRLANPEAYFTYRKQRAPAFFIKPVDRSQYQPFFARWDGGANPVEAADAFARGELVYFGHAAARVGYPPEWHRNPFTEETAPADRHWSRLGDFHHGDVKLLWEAGRFGYVYALVRAYWRTGDDRYARLFWETVEDWQQHNPPQHGVHWKCGQETSFRVMAWCFGLYGFLEAPSTEARQVAALAQMIAVSGRRIEANLDYALSQQNNHGISEALGLWTIGLLFPEFTDASRWKDLGRAALEEQAAALIYEDGAFSQHSVNYHRVMLHDYLWAIRLAELNGSPLSDALKGRVTKAAALLYQLQDEESGRVPSVGHNDGALVLPLDNCDVRDYRPVLQAARYAATATRAYPEGPWDEGLVWLFGPAALDAPVVPPVRANLRAEVGGYYTLRAASGFAFMRCVRAFRHRPAHADQLHVDLWWRGHNMALDPGTYSYNAPPPWDGPFVRTVYHNTVTVDGGDQMGRAARFLWLPWCRGRVRVHVAGEDLAYWEGEHDGYGRPPMKVMHRRGVLRLGGAHWLVLDWLSGAGVHTFRLHWLLPDFPHTWHLEDRRLVLSAPPGAYHVRVGSRPGGAACSLVRADEASPRGWQSPYYAGREPALSLAAVATEKAVLFWTLLGPGASDIVADGSCLHIRTSAWQADVRLGTHEANTLLERVVTTGAFSEALTMD